MTNEDQQAKVAELIKDARIAMLTTVSADGSLVSRPMGVQDVDFDGDLWFFAEEGSHKVHEVEGGSPANAAFADSTAWVSVSGRAEVVRDRAKITGCGARRPRPGSPTVRRRPAWSWWCCAARRPSTGTPRAAA